MMALVVAFFVLSALADNRPTPHRVVSGPVLEFHPGRRIVVAVGASAEYEGMWHQVGLNGDTIYESQRLASAIDPVAIVPGLRVAVTYRCMPGGGHPGCAALRVRVLDEATPR